MKNVSQANGTKKQAGVLILLSEKIDFKPKIVRSNRGGHFILIRGKFHQDDISISICWLQKRI